ncbi:2Fe-2S iron-sulfur cluster-binding protein [Bradyrhizobium sp. TM239]|uniref:2Fe-2S iron-sulfur cluster-binding protein n=1 Tax=Bradyrhizobium sp. TM239 TaxID=2599802 RepID=UPI0030C6D97B
MFHILTVAPEVDRSGLLFERMGSAKSHRSRYNMGMRAGGAMISKPGLGWPFDQSPFHQGERALHELYGRRQQIDFAARRVIQDHLTEQHRVFFGQLPFVLIGSVDHEGQPWASMLVGRPGFMHSTNPVILRFEADPLPGDPLPRHLVDGAPIGVLGIELPTRRRNRISGRFLELDERGFAIRVVQSFGNCPQYIQGRELEFLQERPSASIEHSDRLTQHDITMLAGADAFYIASASPGGPEDISAGADVSHRGGRPGFIRIDDDRTITTPDFVGNYVFNTLGNLSVEPRAGLLFADFKSGDVTMIACRSEVIWEGEELRSFAGAQRLVRFHIKQIIRLCGALPFRAVGSTEVSTEIEGTGTWSEAVQAQKASRELTRWRPFRIVKKDKESRNIVSFVLEPADDGGVAAHLAGQFLPIKVPAGDDGSHLVRSYSLSEVANGRTYRISVKRDGIASCWLHDRPTGAVLDVLPPRGEFIFNTATRKPVMLISAGVGVTPMVAIVNSLLVNDMRTRHAEPIIWLQAARNGGNLAFAAHIIHKVRHHANLSAHFVLSAPNREDQAGRLADHVGRIDRDVLARLLPTSDIDAYLCGPGGFMQSIYDALLGLGVPDRQIHFESFGPARVLRKQEKIRPAGSSQLIRFGRTGKAIAWSSSFGSLLGAAGVAGVTAPYGCKSGVCGSCAARLVRGSVTYTLPPVAELDDSEILLCCTVPEGKDEVVIDV